MAFCMMCGKKLPDGAKFCPVCGAPVTNENSQANSADDTSLPKTQTPTPPSEKLSGKKPKKKLWIVLIIGVVALVALIFMIVTGLVVWAIVDAYYDKQQEIQSGYTDYVTEESTQTYNSEENDSEDDYDEPGYDDNSRLLGMCDYAGDIVEEITKRNGYTSKGLYDSCAVLTDANADDNYELYVVYHEKTDGVVTARAEVWSLEPDNEKLLLMDTLYTEVGGNSGSLGVYAVSGKIYIGVKKSSPDGSQFYDTAKFISLDQIGKPDPHTEEFMANGKVASNSKGTYKIDNKAVTKSDYQKEYDKYYTLFSMPDNSSDSPIVMTIDEFITIYGN